MFLLLVWVLNRSGALWFSTPIPSAGLWAYRRPREARQPGKAFKADPAVMAEVEAIRQVQKRALPQLVR